MSPEDSPPPPGGQHHQQQQHNQPRHHQQNGGKRSRGSSAGGGIGGGGHASVNDATSPTHQQYLGILELILSSTIKGNLKHFSFECLGDAAAALPHWPDLEADSNQLPPGIGIDDLQAFVTLYRDHCEVCM